MAIAWIGALVADLVINKPLGLSPNYIEFKRAYLYNFNPVGFGSMIIASLISITAFLGFLGVYAQAYAPFIALGVALVLSPLIAIITKGKYYIARPNIYLNTGKYDSLINCCICNQKYEPSDTAFCPVYNGAICSLCCTLDARCHDRCKKVNLENNQAQLMINNSSIFQEKLSPYLGRRFTKFIEVFLFIGSLIGIVFAIVYYRVVINSPQFLTTSYSVFLGIFLELYAPLLVLAGIGTWWLVLSEESRELAEEELDKQNWQMQQEITERQRAESALQQLTRELETRVQERTAELSEALNHLKQAQTQLVQTEKMSSLGQLVAGVAHEINNPVNFIHGNLEFAHQYIQETFDLINFYETETSLTRSEIQDKLEEIEWEFIKEDLPRLITSMQVGTERIREIVLSLRNFSRLDEADVKAVDIHLGLESTLMLLGHRLKATSDHPAVTVIKAYGDLPLVECYAGQLNQVFMNILSNALDAFDEQNQSRLFAEIKAAPNQIKISTAVSENEKWIEIRIQDNGVGMTPAVKAKIFDYLYTTKPVGRGTGLGLSISYQIVVEKHGGRLSCESELGKGTTFIIEIPLR